MKPLSEPARLLAEHRAHHGCPGCAGAGHVAHMTCPTCEGTGTNRPDVREALAQEDATMTAYRSSFEDVCHVLGFDLDYSARVRYDDDGEPCAVVVHALSPSIARDPHPVLAALLRNDDPQPGDGPARWGVRIEFPDHLSTYGDDDPTLGEGWDLPPAATADASAELLAAVLLGYMATRECYPTTMARWAEART